MTEQTSSAAAAADWCQALLVLAHFARMYSLPQPIAVEPDGRVVQVDCRLGSGVDVEARLRDFMAWWDTLGRPSVFAKCSDMPSRCVTVSAVGTLTDGGRVEILVNLYPPESALVRPFGKRLVSLDEVRGLLRPPPAPIGSESGSAEAVSR